MCDVCFFLSFFVPIDAECLYPPKKKHNLVMVGRILHMLMVYLLFCQKSNNHLGSPPINNKVT